MKRKVLSAILATAMVASMVVGCGGGSSTTTAPAEEAAEEPAEEAAEDAEAPAEDAEAPAPVAADSEGGKIGVAMPTQSSERWIKDGQNMKEQLEALGYEVDLQYAEDDVQTQFLIMHPLITRE